MRNGWYPKETLGNRNIPEGAVIQGSLVSMSGEIITTYYSFGYNFFRVGSWKYDKPERTTSEEIINIEMSQLRKK